MCQHCTIQQEKRQVHQDLAKCPDFAYLLDTGTCSMRAFQDDKIQKSK